MELENILDAKTDFFKQLEKEEKVVAKSLDALSKVKTKKEAINVFAESAVSLAITQGLLN